VVRVDFGGCVVAGPDGRLIEVTVRGRVMGRKKALGNAVVVGDLVRLSEEAGHRVVEDVAPRRNVFSRRAAGTQPAEQVVAANLDQIVLVASLADPAFKPGLADRVLAQAEHAGIPARVALNKSDLAEPGEAQDIAAAYAAAGYPVHVLCARAAEGVDELRHACRGRRSLMVGHSGVGKSTLLNALAPGIELLEGQVNAKTGKGRHTTTAAWLLRPAPDLELIDTPGVRAFGLWGVGARDLEQAYAEFRAHLGACRFTDCSHRGEPGCALRAAVESGAISRRRFESYLKLREELEQEQSLQRVREGRGQT
jgi:ribosome biogenesis GTPase